MVSVEKLRLPIDSPLPSLARVTARKKTQHAVPIPPPISSREIPWRGHGGRPPTLSSVEFDRQLDKIAVWLETWSHDQVVIWYNGSIYVFVKKKKNQEENISKK